MRRDGGCLFVKGIKGFFEQFVRIMEVAGLDVRVDAFYQLRLMDFKVHVPCPPFQGYRDAVLYATSRQRGFAGQGVCRRLVSPYDGPMLWNKNGSSLEIRIQGELADGRPALDEIVADGASVHLEQMSHDRGGCLKTPRVCISQSELGGN